MEKQIYTVGGIKRMTMIPAKKSATAVNDATFGEFDSSKDGFVGLDLALIAMDSVAQNADDDAKQQSYYEDYPDMVDEWTTQKGKKTLQVIIEDMGAKEYLQGFAKVSAGAMQGWSAETPGFNMESQALEIETLPQGDTGIAMLYRFTPVAVSVKPAGTFSKNGKEQIALTITRLANLNADGAVVPNKYEKAVEAVVAAE